MKLISITSWQRHLFRREALNWSAIGIQASADRLMERYRLNPMVNAQIAVSAVDQAGRLPAIAGAGGEYKADETQHTIEQLIIDPVSLQFQISGDTDAANAFYEDLLGSIEHAAQTKIDRAEKMIATQQTMSVAKMDIDPWKLYSKEWKDFLHAELEPIAATLGGTHRFWPQTFTTAVIYKAEGADFVLTPKPFTLEPRAGTTPEQGIFFMQSPTDSETHLRLMGKVEQAFHI